MPSSSSPNTSDFLTVPGRKVRVRRRLRAPFAFLGPDPRSLPPGLLRADATTLYTVDDHRDWTLRPGAPCAALSDYLTDRGLGGAVYLTGWNPRGWRVPAAANVAAQARLAARVAAQGLAAFPGWGCGTVGNWPPERSLLVPGLPLDTGCALARDFAQRAVIWLPAGGLARIVPAFGPSA